MIDFWLYYMTGLVTLLFGGICLVATNIMFDNNGPEDVTWEEVKEKTTAGHIFISVLAAIVPGINIIGVIFIIIVGIVTIYTLLSNCKIFDFKLFKKKEKNEQPPNRFK